MKRVLKWLGIALLVLVVLPLVVVIAINAFDETLDPQAASVGAPRAPGVPDAENGYYALLAMSADDGADGAAYAKAWVAEARAAAKENRPEKRAEPKREKGAKRDAPCDVSQASCLATLRAKPGEAAAQLDAYKEDMQRYEALIAFKRYEEVLDYPMRVVTALPPFGPMNGAQKAYLVRAALAAEAGDLGGAVTALERDMAFQRVLLDNARTLIGKMVATAAYTRDLALVSHLLRGRGADLAPHVPRLREILKPLSAAALRLSPALEMEFAMTRDVLPDPVASFGHERGASWPERLAVRALYKPNATINRAYRRYAASVAAAAAPAHGIKAAFSAAGQSLGTMGAWDYIDNPVGNILLRVAEPGFGEYAYRLHDLDAYNRLIGLWAEMIAAGVSAENAADFAAKSDARFHDPYTQKPMRWDAEKKRVYFEAQSTFTKRRADGVDGGRVFITP